MHIFYYFRDVMIYWSNDSHLFTVLPTPVTFEAIKGFAWDLGYEYMNGGSGTIDTEKTKCTHHTHT